jgi:hypothetical protein
MSYSSILTGLTKEEIQLAVQRAGVTDESSFPSSGLPSQQQQYPPVPFHNGAVIPGQHLMPRMFHGFANAK